MEEKIIWLAVWSAAFSSGGQLGDEKQILSIQCRTMDLKQPTADFLLSTRLEKKKQKSPLVCYFILFTFIYIFAHSLIFVRIGHREHHQYLDKRKASSPLNVKSLKFHNETISVSGFIISENSFTKNSNNLGKHEKLRKINQFNFCMYVVCN